VQELQNTHPPPLPVLRGDAALLRQNCECSCWPWSWGTSLQGRPKHHSREQLAHSLWEWPRCHDPPCFWLWGGDLGITSLLGGHLLGPQHPPTHPSALTGGPTAPGGGWCSDPLFPAPRVSPGVQLAPLQWPAIRLCQGAAL